MISRKVCNKHETARGFKAGYASRLMGYSRKVWLLVVVGGCMLMLQYQLSFSWSPSIAAPLSLSGSPHAPPDALIHAAVNRLQLEPSVVNALGEDYIRGLAYQLGRELLLSGCETFSSSSNNLPISNTTIYIITPTYRRAEQIPELTRLSQTLMHVPNIVWLVIEDAHNISTNVGNLLEKSLIPYHHLAAPMPPQFKDKKVKPRGVSNRNRGLQWLRANATSGVLYFADDDNTYDLALFNEIRSTKTVAMFPVGLCTKYGVSSPVVSKGKISGFYDGWIGGRKFPVDMAGFAINLKFLFSRPKAAMPYRPGFEEDGFLRSLAPLEPKDIELKAENCTKILVWHTQTKKNEPSAPLNWIKYNNTNIVQLKKQLV